jgi:hypothetical protein
MSIPDLSNAAGASWGAGQMDSVSGASRYVPTAGTDTSATDSVVAQMRSDLQQNSQDFKALKSALNANDLTGATQAYTTLQQAIQTASASAGGQSPFSANSPIGKDFQAIGSALQAGDLTAAKQAFTAFKSDIKSAGRAARAQTLAGVGGVSDSDGDADGSSPGPANPSATIGGLLNTTA